MEQLLLQAIDAALQAGKAILSVYDDPVSDFQIERKADNSPLTIADRMAHETNFLPHVERRRETFAL